MWNSLWIQKLYKLQKIKDKIKSWKKILVWPLNINTFVLPYSELHVTGDGEVILQNVALQLFPFQTLFPYPLLLPISEKLLGFYQLLDYPITAVLPLTNGISVMKVVTIRSSPVDNHICTIPSTDKPQKKDGGKAHKSLVEN